MNQYQIIRGVLRKSFFCYDDKMPGHLDKVAAEIVEAVGREDTKKGAKNVFGNE
jgi:hypothetical protein